jgi:hypothetical protein
MVFPKRRGVSELHGVTTSKTVLFAVTSVRTLNFDTKINVCVS